MEPAVTRLGGSYFDNLLGRWMLGTTAAQLIFTFLFTAVLVSALSLALQGPHEVGAGPKGVSRDGITTTRPSNERAPR